MTPASTSNELDVQNKWDENTQHMRFIVLLAVALLSMADRPITVPGTAVTKNIYIQECLLACLCEAVRLSKLGAIRGCDCQSCLCSARKFWPQLTQPDEYYTPFPMIILPGRTFSVRIVGHLYVHMLSTVIIYQVRQGRRAARSSTSQGSAEPLCVRIEGTNREASEGKADL